jgi:hypothetical protein
VDDRLRFDAALPIHEICDRVKSMMLDAWSAIAGEQIKGTGP